MIRKTLSFFASAICFIFLAACVNLKPVPSITTSYTLGPVDLSPPVRNSTVGEPIYIVRPQVPTYLDGSRLSYRSVSGEVKNIFGARWAEPLAEGIARAMSLYLSKSSSFSVEGYYPWPNTLTNGSRLTLNFQRFGATESGSVQVVANWTLKDSGGKLKKGQFVSSNLIWDVESPDSLVAAYNSALELLADEVERAF